MQMEIVKLLLIPWGQETAGNTCFLSSCLSALSLGEAGIREYAPKPAWIAAWISIGKWLSFLCLPDPASKQRRLRTPVSRLLGPEIQGRRWLEMKADERETIPNRVEKTSGKGREGEINAETEARAPIGFHLRTESSQAVWYRDCWT